MKGKGKVERHGAKQRRSETMSSSGMASCSSTMAKRGDAVLGHCEDELGEGSVRTCEAVQGKGIVSANMAKAQR